MRHLLSLSQTFRIPAVVIVGIIGYFLLLSLQFRGGAVVIVFAVVLLGSFDLLRDTVTAIRRRQFALDYIAILAIGVALATQEYFVAAILALMLSSGRALEGYGYRQAQKSLTQLIDRIPQDVVLWQDDGPGEKVKLGVVTPGQDILIRKGEVIPLDGLLVSEGGLTDESSLTGEPYLMEKVQGDQVRSGTVNIGEPLIIRVTRSEPDSTYKKIVRMVEQAQSEKAPLVRLADRYSGVFTLITLVLSGIAYFISQDVTRVLAVLVVATPCPLILATPIALMGGVNAAAKGRIIVKKLATLEALSRSGAVVFDKTGTITLGRPSFAGVETLSSTYTESELLAIAEAVERNSLHPLAKAIVAFAKEQSVPMLHASDVEERIGSGISGVVNEKRYRLQKAMESEGMAIELVVDGETLARFHFEDEIKGDARAIVSRLQERGVQVCLFTGDKLEAAQRVAGQLGKFILVQAECTPEDKKLGIDNLKRQGRTTAMVGDGINDAPALAYADVGIVFSNEEQTAASEAADVVLLGGELELVAKAFNIAKDTVRIALQSILWGIGLSVAGMVLAALGLIPPIAGALLQEVIDVGVILNALRASRSGLGA